MLIYIMPVRGTELNADNLLQPAEPPKFSIHLFLIRKLKHHGETIPHHRYPKQADGGILLTLQIH